jgi:hypothetical protein
MSCNLDLAGTHLQQYICFELPVIYVNLKRFKLCLAALLCINPPILGWIEVENQLLHQSTTTHGN